MIEPGPSERVRYRFPPLERRGVIAGWRGGQIAVVAVGLVIGVLVLRSRPSVAGVLMALGSLAVALASAFWPIGGRTGEQWLPLLVRWLTTGRPGHRRRPTPAPQRGHLVTAGEADTGSGPVDVRPASADWTSGRRNPFDGIRLVGVSPVPGSSTGEIGMVLDGPARTATAVLAVRGHSFALLGPGDQDARIASWARVLGSLAREGSEVHRVQWTESCLPDNGSSIRDHWDDNAVLGADTTAGRSYRALVDESSPATRRHQVSLGLTISTSRSARTIRAAGGGPVGTGVVLAREIHALHRALDAADVQVDGVLGPGPLSRLVAQAYAPSTAVVGDRSVGWPWPVAVDPHWEAVRVDGTWHATYWIAEWPRVDVTPDFLGPLLFSPLRRSITLVMEPVSPSRAARQVAQARTADLADGELRRRGGFLSTARHARERQSAEERDVELADGHAQYRFSGYVTVTTDRRADLTDACAWLEQAAGQAGVELRLLYGEQDGAFACSLPLGRGLS